MNAVSSSELRALNEKLMQVRTELLDLADSEVHVGYAAAYRATAREVTKLMAKLDKLALAADARDRQQEQESIPGAHT